MPNYKVNGKTYTIPDNEVDLFESDFPEAELHYQTNDGKKYTILANERKDFLTDFPDATELGWNQQPEKEETESKQNDSLVQPMYGSMSYEENISKSSDGAYYPSPLSKEGRADYEPISAEERSRQEYDMLMRQLDEFNAANGSFMDTYEAYEKAAKHQINEGGFALDTMEREYLDANSNDYHTRKQERDALNDRIRSNSYFNQMRMAESDAANEAADGIANLAAQERAANHKLDLQYNLWNMQHQMPYSTGPSVKRALSPEALKHGNAQADLQAAERLYRKTAEIYAAPVNNGEDILKNFAVGAGQRASDLDFWTMGLSAIEDDINARQAFQKIQDKLGSVKELGNLTEAELDELITPEEQILINAFMDNIQAQAARQYNTSGAYKAGQGAADSAMFMAQFLLTGGIGEAATAGTQVHKNVVNWLGRKLGTMSDGLMKDVARGAVKLGIGTAESIGKALVMTPLMPHTYANIADKMMSFDDNGELMNVTDAIIAGASDALIETWSESTGDFVNKVLGVPGDILKGGAKKVLKNVDFSDWGNAMNAPLMKILRKGGFNGFLGEMGEEFIGNAVRSVVGRIAPGSGLDPNAFNEFVQLENLLVTAGSFAPMTILGLGGSAAQFGWQKRQLANAQSVFENMLREGGYTEDQVKFAVDELLGSTDAHLTPEKLVEKFSPMLRELAYNDRFSENKVAAVDSAVKFMWEIARYRAFDGIYHRQEEQQKNDMLAEIQEGTGREFWTTRLSEQAGLDGTAYETDVVRAVEFKDGRVAYVLGGDGVTNTVVYNDGQTGFLSEEQLNEGKATGNITSDATMGLNDYLTQQVARVRMSAEETRMFEERNSNIGQISEQFPVGAAVQMGTAEAPMEGVVLQQTPDGAVVQAPDNTTRLLTWEELGHTIGVEANPQTDAQQDEETINNLEIADLQRRREREQRRAQRNVAAETALEEEQQLDETENEEIEQPIPTRADGSVDQTALWNESPARWAQWKTEQRQDGGAYASSYIQNAIGILEGQIAESEAAFLAEADFDAKDALEQTINQQRARLAELQDLATQYMPSVIPAETSAEATAEQAPAVMAERQKFELDEEYQRRLSLARALAEKEMILKEYFEAISAGSMEAVVMNKQNYKQVMKDLGCSEADIQEVADAIKIAEKDKQAVNALHANGKVFIIAEYNSTVENGRLSYVHERQHNITKRRPEFVQKILSLGLGREKLQNILTRLTGTTFYNDKSDEMLADEIISATMEVAYTYDDLFVTLSKFSLPIELINILNEINDEQRNDYTLVNARRNQIANNNAETSGGENVGDQGEVSGGVLGTEGEGSLENSERRAGNGEPADRAESREVNASNDENVPLPIAEEAELDPETILNEDGFEIDEQNEDVRFSVRYLPTPDQREGIINSIIAVTGRTRDEAERWLDSELSLASIVLNDKEYLDYAPDAKYKAIKDNSDYPQGTVDFNNICRKRKDFTRMYTRLQRSYPNRIFTAEDLADIRTIMSEDGLTVACGLCYVEDRRQKLGEVANAFIEDLQDGFRNYAKKGATKKANAVLFTILVSGDAYIPSIYDLITLEGSDKLYEEHRGIWEAFGAYNRARGQQTQNTFQGYAEYKREILTWSDAKVKKVNSLGGLRIFSYSDFEAHHLLDIIQIIIDCAARGVMIQGYTKVPEFARVVEKTGIKLNRSLIPLGDTGIVDGKLAYDPVEGIDINDPNFLESNDNVGNILIGINDEQIRMAMVDPFIHYIIPYHARQAGNIRAKLNVGAWTNYIDTQNERKISDGKRVEKNINIYTDVLNESVTNDREFVEKYLEVCREKEYIPKFDQFLDKDAEGNYVYTPGYYKFLVDFKLFDEAGNILPQKAVVAEFDDAFNAQVLNDYAREERETTGNQMNSTYDKIVETLDLGEPTEGKDVQFRTSEAPVDILEEARKVVEREDANSKVSFRITPEQDKAYMDAVEAGDMETAQRMVVEAAKLAMPNTKVVDENGNPKVVYHGSTAMFTVFDKSRIGSATGTADGRGFYFTTDRDYALGYKTPNGQLFEVFLNIEKPLSYDKKTITKAQLRKIFKEADRVEYEQEGEHYMLSNYANYNDVGIDGAVNEGANLEYDYADNDVELIGSLIGGSGSFDLIMDAVKKVTGKSGMIAPKDNGTIHYVVTDPIGIKSAEPVTYDNDGNVIPLSQRFNPENEDIRFRVRGDNESALDFHKDTLIDFKRNFNTPKPTTVVDVNDRNAVSEALGYTPEEFTDKMYQQIIDGVNDGGTSLYDAGKKRIAIFAIEDSRRSADVEENIFHENTHGIIAEHPELLELGEWLWDNSQPKSRQQIKQSILDSGYYEGQYHNEMLSRYTGLVLAKGMAGAVMQKLPADQQKHWELILNEFGYEPEREDGNRRRRFESDTRGMGTPGYGQERQQEVSDNGASETRFRTTEITPEVQAEMDVISATALMDGTYLKAPNGADTNLTAEQWAMVRTKSFKSWFGDWENDPENASKVVDENGEPKVVYHGTNLTVANKGIPFWTFYEDQHFGTRAQAEEMARAGRPDAVRNVYETFLNIRNVKRVKDAPQDWILTHSEYWEPIFNEAKAEGYDGLVYQNDWEDSDSKADSFVVFSPSQIKSAIDNTGEFSEEEGDIRFSIRTKSAPKKTGIGYKVFYLKDGKLYPPMVANQGGVDTPMGVWLDAEEGTRAGVSKTGRPKVKQGGKGTQGGSGTLAYRPGWHLGEIPYAIQFNRKDENGDRTLFPADFVWAEVEYANDVDYQDEAMSYGMNANGKFQHSLAGLPKLPTDGSYRYRTNPNPETDPWIITGAMKVNRLLTPSEVDQMVIDAGREPQKRQEGAVTDEQIEALNESLDSVRFSIKENLTEEEKANALQAINRRIAEVHQNKEMSPKSNPVGNPAEPLNNEYSPATAGAQGASLTAKQAKKLVNRKYMMENLADFITDFPEDITLENFAKRLFEGLGLNANDQESDYAHYLSANNIPETIRLSNHSGNSRNIIVKGVRTSKGYSIVIRLDDNYDESKKSNHLDANKWADVDEFVYITPDRERMQDIAKTLFNLLDVDEYVDLAKAEKHYISPKKDSDEVMLRVTGTPTEDVVAEGVSLSPAQLASLAGDIFAALPEESRKKITDGLSGNILGLQDAILQIPTSLATKEEWNDEDRQMAEVIAEQMTKVVGIEMTRPFSASEALWTLYNAVNKSTNLVSEASRALVRRNLGFDSQTLEMEKEAKDGVRFRTVGNASANASASMYNRGAANVWTRLKEVYVDMHASVEKLVKAIEKRSGKKAEGFENILMALNQQSSKGLAAMEAYEQKFLNEMFDEIRWIMDKTDFKYEDIVRYVILKHGLERNEKMAQRDAKAHYQEIYDDIIAKIKGMNPAQKRTYLTNAQLRDADAKAELARLQGVNTSALTPDQLRDHKKELAKAKKEASEAAEHLVKAQKVATLTEQDAQDELDKIFKKIERGTDSVYKEMRKNDYSGISSMFYDTLGVDRKNYATEEEYQSALMQAKADKYDNLGDIEGAAQMEVTLFENTIQTNNLWKSINKATKETLRQQYEANMISKDQYLNLRDMFEFYVPLRGFADNTAEDMYTYYRRPNSTGYTKPILGAEGRKTEAESPFGWIAAMAGSAIASNVKNEAKLALYYFVANRPDNGIATLSRTWFVHTPGDVDANGKKIFRPAYPPFNEDLSSASAKADYEIWQANMRNLQAQGLAYEAGQRLNLGNSVVNISDTNKPEHIVNVKVGGKDYTIVINGNPRAAQAINGDLNIETNDTYNNVLLGPWLRWLSSVNTSYNPEFWATNMMRDVAFTIMAVSIKGDPNYRRKFFKNYRKALKVVSMVVKNEKGTLGNSYVEQQYKDFVKYGGVTGFTQIKDSETWEKEIEKYLKNQDADTTKAIKAVKDGLHAFHRFGESLEQVSRFAAFLTAVETGKSINEAINDAKEITVNFNRKGSGKRITIEEAKLLTKNNGQRLNDVEAAIVSGISYLAPIARSTIMFFNASVQALNAWFKLWKANKLRSLSWVIGYATVGVINALIHALVDDDDEYLDIPQYERRSSLMLGGNGVYFKWALPQEMSAFYALGELSVETIFGRNPHQSAAAEAVKVVGDMLPVNIAKIIMDKGGWVEAVPSQVKPFLELIRNEDYKGDVIFNEQKWLSEGERERTANWESAYKGTGRTYIEISKLLNNLTDSKDLDEAGWINIHPESLEHVVESMAGGVGRTVSKLFNFITAAINPEEDVTVKQTPFLNRFLTINDERYKNVHVNDVYDYYAAEAEHAISLQKQYTKDRNSDALKDLRSSEEYKWARIYSKYKKPIKKYQEAIRAADTTNERMELMKQQDELKRKMIKEISDL